MMSDKAKKTLGTVLFVLVNVGVIAVTAYLEFSKGARRAEYIPFLGLNFRFLFAAAACLAVMIGAEILKYMLMMKKAAGAASFKTAFRVVVIGRYYDFITPFSAGVQPFQMRILSKSGFGTGASVSMPIVSFLVSHTAFMFIATAVFVFGSRFVPSPAVRITAWLGLLFYMSIPIAVSVFTVAPRVTEKVLCFFVSLFHKLRLIKDAPAAEKKVVSALCDYREAVSAMIRTPRLFLKLFGLSLVYHFALYSLPFFVLRTFGGAATFIESFCICVFIYAAISFAPTPGNSGAAEGSFYALFSSLTANYLFWAMLVWRFFCYYSYLLIGGVTLAVSAVSAKKYSDTEVKQ